MAMGHILLGHSVLLVLLKDTDHADSEIKFLEYFLLFLLCCLECQRAAIQLCKQISVSAFHE